MGRAVRLFLRVGLLLLAASELGLGGWTAVDPRGFYDLVPTVNLDPPFSEHLFRDFGGASIGIGIVLAAAGVWLDRRMTLVALTAYLAFALPHLVFHAAHLEHATPAEAVGLIGGLALGVALAIVCAVFAARYRYDSAAPTNAEYSATD